MDISARRAFFYLGVILFWVGSVSLCYQTIFPDYYFSRGLIDTTPDVALIILGSLLQGHIYESLLLAWIASAIYYFSIRPWLAPVVLLVLGAVLLLEQWHHRFDVWQNERYKAILRFDDAGRLKPNDS